MADFSLTTVFVVPTSQTSLPTTDSISTQDLTAGQVGIFKPDYKATTTPGSSAYFYIAQGRENTLFEGSKRSDKIRGCATANCTSNVTEWYKVGGCGSPINQIIEIDNWSAKCGDILTITLRAHSSYLDTLYFNGLTRSVTVQAPCCECDGDPCDDVDVDTLIDLIMEKLTGYNVTSGVINWASPLSEYAPQGPNADNISLNDFFTFSKSGTKLVIEGKALTAHGQPCDVAAFPHEYDRMWFRAFVYSGPATTADFIVSDACNVLADVATVQTSTYATGTSAEIAQLEKNYYSYQVSSLKHLFRQAGWNQKFDVWTEDGAVYDTFYIKFNNIDKSADTWGDYVKQDSMVIIAVEAGSAMSTALETALENALGSVSADNECATTTTTTTAAPTTTTATTGPQ